MGDSSQSRLQLRLPANTLTLIPTPTPVSLVPSGDGVCMKRSARSWIKLIKNYDFDSDFDSSWQKNDSSSKKNDDSDSDSDSCSKKKLTPIPTPKRPKMESAPGLTLTPVSELPIFVKYNPWFPERWLLNNTLQLLPPALASEVIETVLFVCASVWAYETYIMHNYNIMEWWYFTFQSTMKCMTTEVRECWEIFIGTVNKLQTCQVLRRGMSESIAQRIKCAKFGVACQSWVRVWRTL